ncbi:uncharacterized protein LOC125682745 [Ostrea edulis]|uniref:uncharacterized protein LOC125682745 n=1 Tax=Ostrea edulis TaxID=37623 RepID=UPI0024AFA885|nr:uncharacterized protein LOC125682745 [Ostrea edulis]
MDVQASLFLPALFLIHLNAEYSLAFQNCPTSILTVSYTTCPRTEEAWRAAAEKKNCSSIPQTCTSLENFKYHCVTNAFRNESIEVCAPGIFLLGFCAEYNFQGERIQDNYDADCKQFTKPCPSRFESWKSYQFPDCTTINGTNPRDSKLESRPQDLKMNTTSDAPRTHLEKAKQSTETIILVISLAIVSIVVFGIAVLVIRHKQKRKLADTGTNSRHQTTSLYQPSSESEMEALNQDNGV